MPRLLQNTLSRLFELKKIRGIDNVTTDDLRLEPGFVRVADNVDIDTEGMIRRRIGILRRLVTGSAHSFWGDEDKLSFGVLDNNLVQLNLDWTTTILLANVGPSHMNFFKLGDRIFFSNLSVNGYIQNSVAHGFPETVRTERQRMVGGNLIDYFDACLYVAQDGFIFRSIAGNPFEMDLEGNSINVGGPITMMLGVNGPSGESGMYVSGGGKCVYLSNLMPDIYGAKWKALFNVPAKLGSAIRIEGMDIGRGIIGQCIIWSTTLGIFMGLPGGYVKDLTSKHYVIKDIEEGLAFVRWYDGHRQYLFVGQAPAEISGNSIDIRLPGFTAIGTAT